VAQGSQWQAELTDPDREDLQIPEPGHAFSYGISLLHNGTLGTDQVQSGSMLVRYPDTAYQAHGNYGVEYNLTLPLFNPTDQSQRVQIALETPLKENELSHSGLQFFYHPPERIFFRGAIRLTYVDDWGDARRQYIHIVQRRGQAGQPLLWFTMDPGSHRSVKVDFLYPPDSTPPQVLTIKTLAPNQQEEAIPRYEAIPEETPPVPALEQNEALEQDSPPPEETPVNRDHGNSGIRSRNL
jgi:hypothetical protein